MATLVPAALDVEMMRIRKEIAPYGMGTLIFDNTKRVGELLGTCIYFVMVMTIKLHNTLGLGISNGF